MTPWLQDQDLTVWCGDALDVLRGMADGSVDCVVTSPPYWGLRDYGTGEWDGGDDDCDHSGRKLTGDLTEPNEAGQRFRNSSRYSHQDEAATASACRCGARRVDRQLGLEATPDLYVTRMVEVFREVRRVLAAHGTCWVNLGDSYVSDPGKGGSGTPNGRNNRGEQYGRERMAQVRDGKVVHGDVLRPYAVEGLRPKNLVGVPWRVAFALQADGWWLRSDIIWAKPNPMPESVTDRPTKAHEYVFLLTRGPRYWFDAEAVREPHRTADDPRNRNGYEPQRGAWVGGGVNDGRTRTSGASTWPAAGRNVRSVWEIATQPYPEAHFACVDDQTEALTPTGWKRHDELADGDLIAMYDPDTDSCRFAPATFHRYDYDGELVAIDKRDSSQRLTPNHRCLIRRRRGEVAVVEAANLKPSMEILACAPIEGDDLSQRLMRDWEPEWAALAGWFVAEGHTTSIKRVEIYQSESANPQHVQAIRGLLDAVGGDWSERTRHRMYLSRGGTTPISSEVEFVGRGPVATMLQEIAPQKRVHVDALGLREPSRRAMLDALIDGDGHRRTDGRACIIQKDAEHIGAMQALALSLGYRAVVSQRKDGMHVLYLTRGRWLTLRGTNGTHTPIGREHYTGTVWCPNVETGFWLARRNGKPFVTGNTFPEELARRCIVAGCPAEVCRQCGKPRDRIVATSYENPGNRTTNGDRSLERRHETAGFPVRLEKRTSTEGWSDCGHNSYRPGVVLDPFGGSGTVAAVARKHGRRAVLIELNETYCQLIARRTQQQSLLA